MNLQWQWCVRCHEQRPAFCFLGSHTTCSHCQEELLEIKEALRERKIFFVAGFVCGIMAANLPGFWRELRMRGKFERDLKRLEGVWKSDKEMYDHYVNGKWPPPSERPEETP